MDPVAHLLEPLIDGVLQGDAGEIEIRPGLLAVIHPSVSALSGGLIGALASSSFGLGSGSARSAASARSASHG